MTAPVRPALLMLMAAVTFVMVVACANIAGLLLARGVSRSHELAVRRALGAGRGRLARQLLTEQMVVAGIAAAAGVTLACLTARLAAILAPPTIPRLHEVKVDGVVVVFTITLAVATSVLAGLLPALFASRSAPTDSTGFQHSRGVWSRRLQGCFVVAQLAVVLALLVAGGLAVNGLWQMLSIDLGFEPRRALAVELMLPRRLFDDASRYASFRRDLLGRMRALAGATDAGLTSEIPVPAFKDLVVNVKVPSGASDTCVPRIVSDHYLRTLGATITSGRDLVGADEYGAPAVVVNQAFARRFFPGTDTIGQRVWLSEWNTVVGVVRDVRELGPAEAAPPVVYIPFSQRTWTPAGLWLVVRTRGNPEVLAPAVRRSLAELDRNVPLKTLITLGDAVGSTRAEARFYAAALAAFACVGLMLAAVGVFALMSHDVNQRNHEIGVRMVLGAVPRAIGKSVFVRAGVLIAAGQLLGLGLALACTRVLASLLFGVGPTSWTTLVTVSLLLTVTACAAAYPPARRASRIDPIEALRHE